MGMRALSLATIVLGAWLSTAVAQDFDAVKLTTVRLTDDVAVVSGGGGNIGVLTGAEGTLLIDTQFGELEDKIRAAVGEVGSGPVRFVINTHWHFDHVGCNGCFAADGAVIIGPIGTRELMAEAQEFPLLGATSPAFPEEALPTLEVDSELTMHFNGEHIELVHIEGAHSGHDLVVFLRHANVLHAGDLYWSGGYPYIGTPHGGSLDGLIAASNRLLELSDEATRIIPGHGPVTGRAALEEYRDLLVSVRTSIENEIADGRPVDDIVASKPTAATDEARPMGMPPDLFVRLVYRDLVGSD
jgi:glyoxylase-like metal-dependent hydrolase (beta-lactamase superfamily II)